MLTNVSEVPAQRRFYSQYAILALFVTAFCWGVGVLLAAPQLRAFDENPPIFDEAVHLLPVAQLVDNVQNGQFGALLENAYRQDELALYPFLHTWLTAPLMLVTRHDLGQLRAARLLFIGLSALVACLIGSALGGDRPNLAGIVAGLLTLGCLPIWVYGSALYLESVGLLLLLLCLWAYTHAVKDQQRVRWLFVTGGFVIGAFFAKYSFGIFAIGGLALAEFITLISTRQWTWKRWLALGLIPTIIIAGWFLLPGKWARFVVYSQSQFPTYESFWSADNLLFYVRSLRDHFLGAPSLWVLTLIGILGATRQRQWRGTVAFVSAGAIILTFVVPQKEVRFAYPIFPLLFPMLGAVVASLSVWLQKRAAVQPVYWLLLLGGVLLLANDARLITQRLRYYSASLETVLRSSPDTKEAYRFIIDHTLVHNVPPHLISPWHLFTRYGVTWEYYASYEQDAAFDYHLTTGSPAVEPTQANLTELMATLREQNVGMLISIDGSPVGGYSGWEMVAPLWEAQEIGWIADSPSYTLRDWEAAYKLRVLAGDFANEAAWREAREAARREFPIQLHLYYVVAR